MIVTDFSQYQQIKNLNKEDQQKGLEAVAKQFEALFTQQMLKSMRQATDVFAQDNPLHSKQADFYQSMHDSQLSMDLSDNKGLGLADALIRQLSEHSHG